MSIFGVKSTLFNDSSKSLQSDVNVKSTQRLVQIEPRTSHQQHRANSRRDSTHPYHASLKAALSVDEALRIINDRLPEPVAVDTAVTTSIIGSVTAEDVYATTEVPGCYFSADNYIFLNSRLFTRGETLSSSSGAISTLAMAGIQSVKVFEKPRVGLLNIGDETECDAQIREASRLAVLSVLGSWGFEAVELCAFRKNLAGDLEDAFRAVDILLITNTSTIRPDLQTAIDTLGGCIHFNRVSLKPSSHTMFATIPVSAQAAKKALQRTSRPIFVLPGDPASTLVALNLFVLPSLNKISGLGERFKSIAAHARSCVMTQLGLPRVAVVLTHHFPLDPEQTEYHLAVVTGSRSDARLYASSIGAGAVSGSGVQGNALIILRAGRGVGIKGEIVEALLMGPVHGSDTRLIC